jgi:hypothetical protein
MKKLLYLFILSPFSLFGQLPLPCYESNSANLSDLIAFEGETNLSCLVFQEGEEPNITILNDAQRIFHVDYARIDPFFEVNPGEDGEFTIDLLPETEFTGAWMEPLRYDVPQYEKVEWGVRLPTDIQNRINSWIEHQRVNAILPSDINPFDPEQIVIQAKIWYEQNNGEWTSAPAVIDGFYYIPYERNIGSTDKNEWDWDALETEYNFRVRWSPVYVTSHRVELSYWTPESSGVTPFFFFESTPSNPSKSFVKVSENKHYFVTDDNQLYFPIGPNIWEDVYNCACDIPARNHLTEGNMNEPMSASACDSCYLKGTDDWCAGLNKIKLRGAYAPKDNVNVRNMCLPLPGYLKWHERMDKLKEEGGNSFRLHLSPATLDIEYEKMNNYYDRQYQAWEMDRILDHCEELDMRINFNHEIHNSVTIRKFSRDNWDWNNFNYLYEPDPLDRGWCYWRELGLGQTEPLDFFTNEEAKSNYKKKLRYIIARWGYSPSIYVMELFSEINNVGMGNNEPDDGDMNDFLSPYDTGVEGAQEAIYQWHIEMANFIKNTLDHQRHLIAVHYAGHAPHDQKFDADNTSTEESKNRRDRSFLHPLIDVCSISYYSTGKKRFKGLTDGYFKFYTGLEEPDHETNNSDRENNYQTMQKPIILGESGIAEYFDCDSISGRQQLYIQPFTGIANSGHFWHGQSRMRNWDYFDESANFIRLCTEHFGFDFQSGNLVPYYHWVEEDSSFFFPEKEHSPSVYAMHSLDQNMVVGTIANPTVNWFLNDCNLTDILLKFDSAGAYYTSDSTIQYPYNFHRFDSDFDYKIRDLDDGEYFTYFYDPSTLAPLDIHINNRGLFGLNIEFPEAYSEGYPMLFFVTRKNPVRSMEPSETEEPLLLQDEKTLRCYPNPGNGQLTISAQASLGSIKMYTPQGELLYSSQTTESILPIALRDLPSGMYIIITSQGSLKYFVQK